MKRVFSAVVVLLSIASVSYAEPTPAIKYLMSKPLSLMDWGLHHLDEHLKDMYISFYLDTDESKLKTAQLKTTVDYNWEKNRIVINSNPAGVSFVMGAKEPARKLCSEIVKKIRAELKIDSENPAVTPESSFAVDKFFSHSGYRLPDEPKKLVDELLSIIEINTSLSYWAKTDNASGKASQLSCKTPLMSNEAHYSR